MVRTGLTETGQQSMGPGHGGVAMEAMGADPHEGAADLGSKRPVPEHGAGVDSPDSKAPSGPHGSALKRAMSALLSNFWFTTIMTLFTVYALFGDDLKLMAFPRDPSVDETFVVLSTMAFFLFILELVCSCYAKDGYCPWPKVEYTKGNVVFGLVPMPFCRIGSFYFYLDIIATASLIFELPWLMRLPNDPTELDLGDVDASSGLDDDERSPNVDVSALQSARAGRASRAGARAGRIVRIVRMVRLVRLVRLLKVKEGASRKEKVMPESLAAVRRGESVSVGHNEQVHTPTAHVEMTANLHGTGEGQGDQIATGRNDDGKGDEKVKFGKDEDDLIGELLQESHVGKTMSDLTTRRVIVGVLSMLIILPLVTYTPNEEGALNQARLSHKLFVQKDICEANLEDSCPSTTAFRSGWETTNEVFKEDFTGSLAHLVKLSFTVKTNIPIPETKTEEWLRNEDRKDLVRYDALQRIIVTSFVVLNDTGSEYRRDYETHAVLDKSNAKREEAVFSFILTWFVILLLGVGTMVFASDTKRLVIDPIENMMKRVTEISENPLSTGHGVKTSTEQEGMETTFLLQTIDKIGNLMRIGFGEAGAEIIAANLRDAHDDRLNVNDILRGRPINSIFGFCDIRNFTDTTECLQEEVMTFVNKVAHILHNVVKDCNGAANKNIGDAFLLSWKLPPNYEKQYCDLFDKALYAFLKFTVLLRRFDSFVTEFSPSASQRLYQRMPNYRCAMGMGLHVGEAVEGAIGTPQKIDATYISLHVNNAEFLESSTKAYKVPLLMSHFFYDRLSPVAKEKCRMLDVVKVTDSLTFQLWTYDIDFDADYSEGAPPMGPKSPRHMRLPSPRKETDEEASKVQGGLQKRESQKSFRMDAEKSTDMHVSKQPVPTIHTFEHGATKFSTKLWSEDPDMLKLRHKMDNTDLMDLWRHSIHSYVTGDWPAAIEGLEAFQHQFDDLNDCLDGPAEFLLKFMKAQPGCQAPSNWDGSHE